MEQSAEKNPESDLESGRPLSGVVIFEMIVQDNYSCDVLQPEVELSNPQDEPTEEFDSRESAYSEQSGDQQATSSESSSGDRKSDEESPTAAASAEQNSPKRSSDLDTKESPVSKPVETELQEEAQGSNSGQDPALEKVQGSSGGQDPALEEARGSNSGQDPAPEEVQGSNDAQDPAAEEGAKQPSAASEETSWDPEKQVQAFTTEKELFPLLQHLKRIPLAELREDSDLENGYIGGRVLAQCLEDTSQGHIEILVTDDSLAPKHVTCYLEGDITNLYPQQSGMEGQLYLHRVKVDSMFVEYSQDFDLCVNVRGKEPRLWVVHRDAKLRNFLPGLGGSRRKNRKKKKKKMKKVVGEVGVAWKEWAELNRPHIEGVEEAERTADDHEQQHPTIPTADDTPAEATHSRVAEDNSHAETGRDAEATHSRVAEDNSHADPGRDDMSTPEQSKHCQTSGQQSSFPDNFDLSESALRDYHTDDERVPSDKEISSVSPSYSEPESEEISTDERDDDWEPKSKRRKVGDTGRKYEYKKIADLEVNDKKMNIFGVVSDFKSPFRTRGADYCCFVTIVDESCPNAGIKCVLFNQNQDKLPQVKSIGDIVCLHRVNITERNSSPSVEGTPFSSYLCFDGQPRSKLKPRTGSFSYTFVSRDKTRVKELRHWAAQWEGSRQIRRLESVVPNTSFDLTCQVISITPYLPQCCASVLTVWDGTRLPLGNRKIDMSAYRSVSDPGLQHAAGVLAENVVVYDESSIDAATLVKPGQFVVIRCIRAETVQNGDSDSSALVELCVPKDCSRGNVCVKGLAVDDPDVSKLKEELPNTPLPSFSDCSINNPPSVTSTLHPTVPLMPLNKVCSWEAVPSKFRCRVTVSVISPSSVEEMVKLVCQNCGLVAPVPHGLESSTSRIPCPECNELNLTDPNDPPALSYTYLFKLLIQDGTGKLVVYVSEGDAVTFLPGLPPVNLYQDQQLRYKLLDRLYYLTGGNSPFAAEPSTRPRPWVECCILSYRHEPRNHSSSVLYYRIFDTILQDPQL